MRAGRERERMERLPETQAFLSSVGAVGSLGLAAASRLFFSTMPRELTMIHAPTEAMVITVPRDGSPAKANDGTKTSGESVRKKREDMVRKRKRGVLRRTKRRGTKTSQTNAIKGKV